MTEHFLNGPEVCAALQQMCRGTVPQAVWSQIWQAFDGRQALMYDAPRGARVEPAAARSE